MSRPVALGLAIGIAALALLLALLAQVGHRPGSGLPLEVGSTQPVSPIESKASPRPDGEVDWRGSEGAASSGQRLYQQGDSERDSYAVIEGKVVPPVAPTAISWADMEVSWTLDPDRALPKEDGAFVRASPSSARSARPDEGGAFVLAHVPAGLLLELHAKNPFGPEWIEKLRRLEAGEVRRIEIALEPGITITGRVIDEGGMPVEGVQVRTEDEMAEWTRRSGNAERTDADGRFVLRNVAQGFTKVVADGKDLAQAGWEHVDGRKGDVHDLVLSVARGGCIAGTVVWPDRSPVERFEIGASTLLTTRVESGSAGRFRLCGLEGPHRLEVRAARGEVSWVARARSVEPGGGPIELVLEEVRTFELHGSVVDEQGSAIAAFSIHAVGLDSEPRFRPGVPAPDGTFVLSGLEAGTWAVEAGASGYRSSSRRVVVPDEGSLSLCFALQRENRIRGTVLDPSGAPVAGAWVGEESHAFTIQAFGLEDSGTDAEGQFEVQASGARPRILAHKRGFASSEVRELELGSGASADGIVLALRETCSVQGCVLDERGEPLSGAMVSAVRIAFAPQEAATDASGAFELTGLPPGSVRFLALHPRRVDAHASATLVLVPGRASKVDLRFEERDPVLVHGRITRGGQPIECRLWLRSPSFTAEGASGPDGSFELTVPRSGDWKGAVWATSEDLGLEDPRTDDVRRFEVAIPDVDEHSFDLEVDALPRLNAMEELLR